MEYIHQKIAATQQHNSRWAAKIVVHIPPPPCGLALMNTKKSTLPLSLLSNDNLSTTNIAPLLFHPHVVMATFLEKQLKYPPWCFIFLEGFNQVKDGQQVCTYLIDTASTSDCTQLVVGINRTFQTLIPSGE